MSNSNNTSTLHGTRILSLALNLPGPAALMRCRDMGATCTKLEPPPRHGVPADPMGAYNPEAYQTMHQGLRTVHADLKTPEGQATLHAELANTDVLITSFRPSALRKLGLAWPELQARYPRLSLVEIVGAPGERAEEPGHDLTYLADALQTSEAVLQCLLQRVQSGTGSRREVALSQAAAWLALPRHWGLTRPEGAVGGAHAGYRVYRCADGRVAEAALEPHFAQSLCRAAGIEAADLKAMFAPELHRAVAAFIGSQTRAQLDQLATEHDVPLYTLAD